MKMKAFGRVEKGKENISQWLSATNFSRKIYRKENIRVWGHRTRWLGPVCCPEAVGDTLPLPFVVPEVLGETPPELQADAQSEEIKDNLMSTNSPQSL